MQEGKGLYNTLISQYSCYMYFMNKKGYITPIVREQEEKKILNIKSKGE